MSGTITYFAVIGGDRTVDRPYGLVRRLEHNDGPSDEGLRKDLSWAFTPAIVEWERGDPGQELVEVSHQQATKIIDYFREKWRSDEQLHEVADPIAVLEDSRLVVREPTPVQKDTVTTSATPAPPVQPGLAPPSE